LAVSSPPLRFQLPSYTDSHAYSGFYPSESDPRVPSLLSVVPLRFPARILQRCRVPSHEFSKGPPVTALSWFFPLVPQTYSLRRPLPRALSSLRCSATVIREFGASFGSLWSVRGCYSLPGAPNPFAHVPTDAFTTLLCAARFPVLTSEFSPVVSLPRLHLYGWFRGSFYTVSLSSELGLSLIPPTRLFDRAMASP
jgi:hypothetical protein